MQALSKNVAVKPINGCEPAGGADSRAGSLNERGGMGAQSPGQTDDSLPRQPASVNFPRVTPELEVDSRVIEHAGNQALGCAKGKQGMVDPTPKPDLTSATPAFGRRLAPRLRLSLPAQLIAVEKAHTCILLNLSRTGAQVAILDAMREGESAILRCGIINQFAIVTRSEFSLNALAFEEPLTDAIVLEIRRYFEHFEASKRRSLVETARKWVTGEPEDDRAI